MAGTAAAARNLTARNKNLRTAAVELSALFEKRSPYSLSVWLRSSFREMGEACMETQRLARPSERPNDEVDR